tara:strand:+ start:57803 stop:58195 length:393 start_codon:yes stop_codon:yes gene_type:complete
MKKINFLKKTANVNSNKLTSILALMVSLGTFLLLFYETRLTREQQYVTVLPYLIISQSMPEIGEYRIYVANEKSCLGTSLLGKQIANRWSQGGDYFGLTTAEDSRFHLLWPDARKGKFDLMTSTNSIELN